MIEGVGESSLVQLLVTVDKAKTVGCDQEFIEVLVANPLIADVIALSSKQVYVLGKKAGTTSLTLYDRSNRLIAVMDVVVGPDVITLKRQLSEMAVSLSPGHTYTLYLGGRNLDPRKLSVSFTSPFIRAVPGTMKSLDYGDEISVVSLDVRVSSRAAAGDYTIYAETEKDSKRALIGGLTIENFPTFSPNPASFQE